MSRTDFQNLKRELRDLFAAEHTAILTADFSVIESIYERKLNLSKKMEEMDLNGQAEFVEELRAKVSQNQKMYDASLRGIKLAKEHIEEIRSAIDHLKTYDGGGKIAIKNLNESTISIKA